MDDDSAAVGGHSKAETWKTNEKLERHYTWRL